MISKVENQKRTPDDLKQRVINAKKKLPKGVVPLLAHKWSKYNTTKGIVKLTNIVQLKTVSEPVTKKLEQLVEILKPIKK